MCGGWGMCRRMSVDMKLLLNSFPFKTFADLVMWERSCIKLLICAE